MRPDFDARHDILVELGIACRHVVNDETARVYLTALDRFETGILAEGCGRLMQTAKFFPSVGEIVEQCGYVLAEEMRLRAEEDRRTERALYADEPPLATPRHAMLMEWLKDSVDAIRKDLPRPPHPRLFETSDITYRCVECHDTGFVRACHCEKPGCKTCQAETVMRCPCRPSAPLMATPDPAQPKRARHTKNWHRLGE